MMNTGQKLVYMANQISDFFKSYPHDQAVKGISEHIKKFWDPRMLKQIYAIIEQPDHGLKPEALEALQKLAAAKKSSAVQQDATPTG